MPNSLVKFANRTDGNGRGQLFWGRASEDGLPFRGTSAPTFTEEEYEARVTRVSDPFNGTFRTWKAAENKAYLDVMDQILNNWARLIFIERWKVRVKLDGHIVLRHVVYVEWAQYCLEDGSRVQANHGQPVELSHGQAPSSNHSFPGAR